MSNQAFHARQADAAESQSASRAENEEVEQDAGGGEFSAYACECTESCDATVSLTPDEYERVREVSTHFLVSPGHLVVGVDVVVDVRPRYEVVEKIGAGAPVARALDTRSHPQLERVAG